MNGDVPAYPTSMPKEAWGTAIKLVLGQLTKEEMPHAVHVGWAAAGFALGQFLPHVDVFAASPPLTDEDRQAAIKAMENMRDGVVSDFGTLPWRTIIQVILEILLRLGPA